jgi:hypothetical protein
MNPIILTFLLLASILFVFFIIPVISLIGFTVILGKANHAPIIKKKHLTYPQLSLKKIIHKGKKIWVDA